MGLMDPGVFLSVCLNIGKTIPCLFVCFVCVFKKKTKEQSRGRLVKDTGKKLNDGISLL